MVDITYTRPWVYPKQRQAIFNDSRYSLIEASTKTGKTVGCIFWLCEEAIKGRDGQNFWWVAPVSSQAEIAFRRLKRYLPRDIFEANETLHTITLFNGACIWFKSADKPDSLYGEDVWGAVVDEASRVKDAAWFAVRSTLTATRGKVRIIGNVKGRKNWFYMLCRKAEANEEGYHYSKLTAYDAADAGVLTYEEIEDAKRTLPENVFRELYLAEPSDDGGNPFGLSHIDACVISRFSGNTPVAWGWDLAKSVDWTVGVALDEYGQVSHFHRWQKPWQETIENIIQITGSTPALIDSTGVGDPILEALQSKGGGNFEGQKFNQSSKQQMMEGLASAIQQKLVKYPAGELHNELKEFEYEYTRTGVRYTAPEGMHDDCVCALALAVRHYGLRHAGKTSFNELMSELYG